MVKKLSKYFILVVIGLMMFIPANVFAENDVVESVVLEYFTGSNTALSYAIDADKSVEKVSVDNAEVSTSNYTVANGSLSFTSEYLDSLTVGNHGVVIAYEESSINISIEVKENVISSEEEPDTSLEDSNDNDAVVTTEEITNMLPDYYFVSVDEKDASSDVVKNEVYNSVIDTLTSNEVNNNYNVSVEVGYPEDIFAVEVSVTNTTDEEETTTKNGTIVYANADNYVESDYELVNEFVNNNDFVYKNSYELVDDFSNAIYSLEDVQGYVADMFDGSSIEYEFNEITNNENNGLVGNILMFVNSKYYASSYFYYKNVPYVCVPYFVEDVNSYVASKAYEILVTKYYLDGHSLVYRNGHLIDDTTGYDYGEFDYVVDDSYEFTYVSGDTVYEKLSNTNMEIKFDENLGEAISLTIGDASVDNSSYSIDNDTLIINYDYLNTLKNNNYDLVLNTDRGVAELQITIIPKQYKYIDGADSVVDKGVKKTLTVRINADVNKFVNVYLNNNALSSDVYSIREGSTIIDISFDYLKELSNGVYKLKTIFTDGEAVTNLSISGTKNDYKINSVSNQTYEKQSNNNVTFNLNRVTNIVNLDINGVSIGNSNYYVSGNNVIVKGSYLNNLNNGKYNVSIKFNDGSVNSYLNVKEKSSQSSSGSTSTGGSSYVSSKTYYRPTYVYTYDYDDESDNDVNVEETKVEETKTEENNTLEVVPDSEKTKDTKKDTTKKETKKSTTKKSTTKKTTKKTTEKKNDSSKKSIFSIFKKKDDSTKTTKTTKTTEKKSESKKSLFSIFKKKDDSTKSSKEEKKLSEKKTDSSKKSIFSIFKKKDDSDKKTTEKKVNEKEKNSSKKSTSKKNKTTSKKNLSSETKNNDSNDSKPMLLTIDKIVNSRIFIASLIVLICGLSCYILYMVTKKDEEE